MTPRDKRIYGIAMLCAVAAGLFPPWAFYRVGTPYGYHFLFTPPQQNIHVDTTRLFLEWILIGGVGLAVRFLWGVK